MACLGRVYEKDVSEALHFARELGWLMAAELRAFDIDISFAPVMDRDHGISAVIGDRAYSSDPKAIVGLCSAFIAGMHEAGMASTGKHFPGHGAVEADSHIDIPVDDRARSVIEQEDMSIFKEMSQRGMDAVMPAHVIYPSVDSLPAGFSSVWIDILRNACAFDGVIFSDDLSMEGASVAGSFEERADAALEAGCDMVLVCNDAAAADLVIEHLSGRAFSADDKSVARLCKMQGGEQHSWNELHSSSRWKTAVHIAEDLMTSGA
jgi:beta-N-acetylhexosaminidase